MKRNNLYIIVLFFITLFFSCSVKNPVSTQTGQLSLSVRLPEPSAAILQKSTSLSIDRAHISVRNSSNSTVVDQDLSRTDSAFQGSFEVAVGSGYTVAVSCYQSSVLIYQGTEDNISVQGGRTTNVTIPLTSSLQHIEISPFYAVLDQNETQQFTVNAVFQDDSQLDITSSVTWSVNSEAGSVSSDGLFTASGSLMNHATLTATCDGQQATAKIYYACYNMAYVSSGEFTMGSDDGDPDEQPVHTVYLDDYYVDKYEVTNSEYATFLNEALACDSVQASSESVTKNGAELLDLDDEHCEISYTGGQFSANSGRENHPVIEVTWYGAVAYAEHYGKRLPTEAEWEKAARGTDGRTWPCGNEEPTAAHCNFDNNTGVRVTVGSYSPTGDSPYGCCDMSGNVREWCADWYDEDYYSISPSSNPQGPPGSLNRVVRSGMWEDPGEWVDCSDRHRFDPGMSGNTVGFRCAR